jgi:hypothetical protein
VIWYLDGNGIGKSWERRERREGSLLRFVGFHLGFTRFGGLRWWIVFGYDCADFGWCDQIVEGYLALRGVDVACSLMDIACAGFNMILHTISQVSVHDCLVVFLGSGRIP